MNLPQMWKMPEETATAHDTFAQAKVTSKRWLTGDIELICISDPVIC